LSLGSGRKVADKDQYYIKRRAQYLSYSWRLPHSFDLGQLIRFHTWVEYNVNSKIPVSGHVALYSSEVSYYNLLGSLSYN
jgi:hypothetical protein